MLSFTVSGCVLRCHTASDSVQSYQKNAQRHLVRFLQSIYRFKRFRFETILQWKLHPTFFPLLFSQFQWIQPHNEMANWMAHQQHNTLNVHTVRTVTMPFFIVLCSGMLLSVIVDSFCIWFDSSAFVTVNSYEHPWNHVYVQMIAFSHVATTSRKETSYIFSKHSNHYHFNALYISCTHQNIKWKKKNTWKGLAFQVPTDNEPYESTWTTILIFNYTFFVLSDFVCQ